MKIVRQELLNSLVAVQPGLDASEVVEQGTSFVFRNKEVITFNDEIAISAAVDVDFECAVPSTKLIALLKRMKDEELDITVKNGELILTGVKATAGLPTEETISLPVDSIDEMGDCKTLPADFCEAMTLCAPCAARDMSRPQLACVHVAGRYVEATDGFRISRYDLGAKVKMPEFLITAASAKIIAAYAPIEYSITDSWVHFVTKDEVYLSLRVFDDTYPPVAKQFDFKGHTLELPKELSDVFSRTKLFSVENKVSVPLRVSLKKNKMTLYAASADGWLEETIKVDYKDEPIEFQVNNDFFEHAQSLLSHAVIEDDESGTRRMMLTGDKLQYVICLFQGVDE